MMILHSGSNGTSLISLPRDSYVTIPAWTDSKGKQHKRVEEQAQRRLRLRRRPAADQDHRGHHRRAHRPLRRGRLRRLREGHRRRRRGGHVPGQADQGRAVRRRPEGRLPDPQRRPGPGLRPRALRRPARRHRPHAAPAHLPGGAGAQGVLHGRHPEPLQAGPGAGQLAGRLQGQRRHEPGRPVRHVPEHEGGQRRQRPHHRGADRERELQRARRRVLASCGTRRSPRSCGAR